MRIGIQVPQFGPHSSGSAIRDLAQEVEERGLDSVWVSDHVVVPTVNESDYPHSRKGLDTDNLQRCFEAVTTLGFLASATSRVRLGTSVLVPALRHPVLAASMLATVDALSEGRLVLGLGAGWLREEFDALGAPTYERRGALLEEIVEIFTALWATGRADHRGEFFSFREVVSEPQPVQGPRPPVWIGGNSPVAIARAARIADGWHAARLNPTEFAAGVARLRDAGSAAGRDADRIEPSLTVLLRLQDAEIEPDRLRDLVGTPAAIARRLAEYAHAGAQTVVLGLDPREPLDQRTRTLDVLVNEILPARDDLMSSTEHRP